MTVQPMADDRPDSQTATAGPAPVRVLKRAHLAAVSETVRHAAREQRAIEAQIDAAVDARVAAVTAELEAGQQAAMTAAVDRLSRAVSLATETLPRELAATVDRLADDLVETAAALAEWLCATGGPASPAWTEGLVDRISAALVQLTAGESAVVRLSPVDAAALSAAASPELSSVTLHPDPSMSAGDAVVTTDSGDVDLTLRTALRRAVETITGRTAAALTDHRGMQ